MIFTEKNYEFLTGNYYLPIIIGESSNLLFLTLSKMGKFNKKAFLFKILITLINIFILQLTFFEDTIKSVNYLENTSINEIRSVLSNCDICTYPSSISVRIDPLRSTVDCFPNNNPYTDAFKPYKNQSQTSDSTVCQKNGCYTLRYDHILDDYIGDNLYSKSRLHFLVDCDSTNQYVTFVSFDPKVEGKIFNLDPRFLKIIFDYMIYFPSLYFLITFDFRSFSFMLIIMNSLTINNTYSLTIRMFISLNLSMILSNTDDKIKCKSILLIKKYKIFKSLSEKENCLIKMMNMNPKSENVFCKLQRTHISTGKTLINKTLLLRIYFTGLLMKSIHDFDYFDIIFSLFDETQLNVIRDNFCDKLFF